MQDEQKTPEQLIAELTALRQQVADQARQIAVLETQTHQYQLVESALQASETRLRLMQEEVQDYAIFAIDPVGRISTWNAGIERILGYQESEFVGQPGAIIFTPEDRAAGADRQELQTATQTGRAADERWHLRKDGSRFWTSGVLIALPDEAGNLQGFIKVMRDRTEQHQSEQDSLEQLEREQLIRKVLQTMLAVQQQSEARFQRIFAAGPIGMIFGNLCGKITEANDPFLQLVGYNRADLQVGKLRWDVMTPPEFHYLMEQARQELQQNGVCTPFEQEFMHQDGSRIPVVVAAVLLEAASQETFAFVLDISQRKAAEQALQSAIQTSHRYTAQLQGLMQASLGINSAVSLEAMLTLITEQARSLIGAHQATTSVILDQQRQQAIEVVATFNQPTDCQQREGNFNPDLDALLPPIGQSCHFQPTPLPSYPFWYEFSYSARHAAPNGSILATPLIGRKGHPIGIIQVTDQSERTFTDTDEAILVQLAQLAAVAIENVQLYQAAQEANRIKDEFLSICSHELGVAPQLP
jgi:PAS domain S-box-containing protein